jgi:hypothetical protein
MQRIILGIITLASIVVAAAPSALAQSYPARPVRVITLTAARSTSWRARSRKI